MKSILLPLLLVSTLFCYSQKETNSPLNYVNIFIGTSGTGHTHPSSSLPFGMIQLGPDTKYNGWEACSGYTYTDTEIYGFSHTHLSGTGVEDLCDVLVTPQIGAIKWTAKYKDPNGYAHSFKKENETASPGYYSVKLDNGIKADFTVTERAGIHRYSFPKTNEQKSILLDLTHRDQLLDFTLNADENGHISGNRLSKSWVSNQNLFFDLDFSTPPKEIVFNKEKNKVAFIFESNVENIEIRVGLSYTDLEGAQKNKKEELKNLTFNQVRNLATQKWEKEFETVMTSSSDTTALINFYTGLYHAYLCPNILSDVDGRYRFREQIFQLPAQKKQYSTFSLWDTFRSTHPWYVVFQKERTIDFIESFNRIFENRGDLPVWDLAGEETNCMIGFHSVSVIADAYVKGITSIPVEELIKAVTSASNLAKFSRDKFNENNYLDYTIEHESVSKSLEYAYDSYCIYQFLNKAKQNGFSVDNRLLDEYLKRSLFFINHYNPSNQFMQARNGGVWDKNFNPNAVMFHYTEGNSWQYSLFAPHAIGVLKQLMGGEDALEKWLDNLFTADSNLAGIHQVDITGLIGQYAHGNEPSHHVAYLYNYTKSPHKGNQIIHKIVKEFYLNNPDGLIGNEDCGQMSSWLNWTNLGLFPICPGNTIYEFGLPQFDTTRFLFDSHWITVSREQQSSESIYIQDVLVDNKSWGKRFITHEDLAKYSTIHFILGDEPSKMYSEKEQAPTLNSIGNYIPLPFIKKGEAHFEKETTIELGTVYSEKFIIQYQSNNSKWMNYTVPFHLSKSATLKIRNKDKNEDRFSEEVTNYFKKKDGSVTITLETPPSKTYSANLEESLLDGQFGGSEYRNGHWLGWNNPTVTGTIVFTKPKTINELSFNFLIDLSPWIFPIKNIQLEFELKNGEKIIRTLENPIYSIELPHDSKSRNVIPHVESLKNVKKVKFVFENYGLLPDWHPGAGSKTWIFLDEITIK